MACYDASQLPAASSVMGSAAGQLGGSPGSAPKRDPATPTQTGPAVRSQATVEGEAATCCSSLGIVAAEAVADADAAAAAAAAAAERGSVVAGRLDGETRHSAPGSCTTCWNIPSGILAKGTDASSPSPPLPSQRMPSSR